MQDNWEYFGQIRPYETFLDDVGHQLVKTGSSTARPKTGGQQIYVFNRSDRVKRIADASPRYYSVNRRS